MALKTMIKKLTNAKKAYDAELAKVGKKTAKEIAKMIGPLVPPGWKLHWTQGTPSFNDGDPCTFSVHDPNLVRADEEDEDEDEDLDEEDGDSDEESDDDPDDEEDEPEEDSGAAPTTNEAEGEDEEEDSGAPVEISLDNAVERYGKKNKRRYYEQDDYARPIAGEKDKRGGQKYEKTRHHYVEHGFPAIAGYSVSKLKQLVKLWHSLPEDLFEAAFGDGAEVTIHANGKLDNDEYYCE